MQYWVAITDGDWFSTLRQLQPDEVNFWQPSEKRPRNMKPGWPFLFKLHSPRNYVVGGGVFVRFTALPSFLAWDAFGKKNGALSLSGLLARIGRYRGQGQHGAATEIGCNILASPFFLDEHEWIRVPKDWPRNVQRGFTYDTESASGSELWRAVVERLSGDLADTLKAPRFGREFLTRARLGQGTFRTLVTEAYHRRCAVTGERSLPALEAAHIKAHNSQGPNLTENGLLLRADIHRLFDRGYVTVDSGFRFTVSRKLREDFENGKAYYLLDGKRLPYLPDAVADRPAREFLDWHNTNVYVG